MECNITLSDQGTGLNSKRLLSQCCNSINKIQAELTRERSLKKQYECTLFNLKEELLNEIKYRKEAEDEITYLANELTNARELYQIKDLEIQKWENENLVLKNENEILFKKIDEERKYTRFRIAEILKKINGSEVDVQSNAPVRLEINQELTIIELNAEKKHLKNSINELEELVDDLRQKITNYENKEQDEKILQDKLKALLEKEEKLRNLEGQVTLFKEMNLKLQMENRDMLIEVGEFIRNSNDTLYALEAERESFVNDQKQISAEVEQLKIQVSELLDENKNLRTARRILTDKVEFLESSKRKEDFLREQNAILREVQYKRWEFDDVITKRRTVIASAPFLAPKISVLRHKPRSMQK